MMTCPKCDREILPGQHVTFVTADGQDPFEARIVLSEDIITAHLTCPPDTTSATTDESA